MITKRSIRLSKRSAVSTATVQGLPPITFPSPRFTRGRSVFTALKNRKTVRSMDKKKIPMQMLSNLLWAACGVNRKKGSFGIRGRTAASASNAQEIDLYVAMAEGVCRYEASSHKLISVLGKDLRALAIGPGQVNSGAKAPVRLIYIVNIDKFSKAGFQEPGLHNLEIQKSYYYIDSGLMAENVYLFAASQGLATWFHNCNRAALAKKLKLRSGQRALFGQTVGYPGHY